MNDSFFRMREIDKDYIMGGEPVRVLKKISLSIREGEYRSILRGDHPGTVVQILPQEHRGCKTVCVIHMDPSCEKRV